MSAPPQLQHCDEEMLLTRGRADEDRAPRTEAHLESKSETGKTPVVKYVRIQESNPRTAVIRIESNVGFAAPVDAANPANSKCPIDDPEEVRVSNLSYVSIEAVAQSVASRQHG